MDEKTAYQLLIEMTPEDKKVEVEKIFRKTSQITDENDGLFQIILVMGIYQNFFRNIPEKFQNAVDDFHKDANAEIKAMIKITRINASIERNLRFLIITIYAIILIISALIVGNFLTFTSSNVDAEKNSQQDMPISETTITYSEKQVSKPEIKYNSYIDKDDKNE